MKVVILCGGEGTRLKEETEFKPKPMVKIGGMPILWHIMKFYSHYGFKDFVLCLGYKGDVIRQYFLNHELMKRDFTISLKGGDKTIHDGEKYSEDWNITMAETGAKSMTGARIKRIEKYINEDEFMLTYGDGLSDVNIKNLVEHHHKKNTIGTLSGVNPQSRFGLIKTDENSIVTKFVEKPVLYDEYVNGGFCVFKKDVFDYITADDSCVFETKPLSELAGKKQLSVYKHNGFWYCMDTYRDYLDLNNEWNSGNAPWKIWK
jgi:glucose-1-phosphate cytidylyltransferase